MKCSLIINAGELTINKPDTLRFGHKATLDGILQAVLSDIEFRTDIDIDELLAEHRAIAFTVSADDVVNTIRPDLSADQAWSLLLAFRDRSRWNLGYTLTLINRLASELFPPPPNISGPTTDPVNTPESSKENTNCLRSIACPQCGNSSRILIEARTMAEVTDDGAETFGDMEWDGDSYAECPECHRHGTLNEFQNANATANTIHAQEE